MYLVSLRAFASFATKKIPLPNPPIDSTTLKGINAAGYLLLRQSGIETYGETDAHQNPYQNLEIVKAVATRNNCPYAKVGTKPGSSELIIIEIFNDHLGKAPKGK